MKTAALILAIVGLAWGVGAARADETTATKWVSPDERVEVFKLATAPETVTDDNRHYAKNEILMVRFAKEKQDVGLYLARAAMMRVIWSPDSRFFLVGSVSYPNSSDLKLYRAKSDDENGSMTVSLLFERSIADEIDKAADLRWSFVRWELDKKQVVLSEFKGKEERGKIEVDLRTQPIRTFSYRVHNDRLKTEEGKFLGFVSYDYMHAVFRMKDGTISSASPMSTAGMTYFLALHRGENVAFTHEEIDQYIPEAEGFGPWDFIRSVKVGGLTNEQWWREQTSKMSEGELRKKYDPIEEKSEIVGKAYDDLVKEQEAREKQESH